ncbi:MAG: hypothetical protein PHS97_02030 [Oscillospiraceae bacterium]|nr:hypothetical protein [Oscillospiraceae bacterium]
MVKVIMGLKGSGKTKQLIGSINDAVHNESGSVVCMEKGNKLRFDIDYRARLIEADDYGIDSYTFLKGFISGLHAGNFDITDLYIDGLYRIVGTDSVPDTDEFLQWVDQFATANNMKVTITISEDIEKATDGIKKFF